MIWPLLALAVIVFYALRACPGRGEKWAVVIVALLALSASGTGAGLASTVLVAVLAGVAVWGIRRADGRR